MTPFRTLLALALAFALGSAQAEPHLAAQVTRVIDGDTVVVRLADGREERVRLIGVDTPELNHGGTPEPLAVEATAFAQHYLLGRDVILELDLGHRDRFGRLLAHLWLDNTLFNLTLIEHGYAVLMTIPPNIRYVDHLLAAQERARAAQRGLWAPPLFAQRCVDLNQAPLEDLTRITHLGPERAAAVIAGRPWTSLDELERLPGLSPARIADMRAQGLACQ